MRFGMLVDAACDLPASLVTEHDVHVLPIPIRVADKVAVDTRDEDSTRKFYERVLAAGITDVESLPYSEEQLEALFLDKLVLDFDYVICLVVDSKHSPIFERAQKSSLQILTRYRAARQAAGMAGPFSMRVFDSGNLFAAQGVQVLELARLLRADTPVTRIFERMEEVIAQTYGYIVSDDLYYMYTRARRRGDRGVNFLGYTLGNALDVKPVTRCLRGKTAQVAKVRHFTAAAERVFANVTREIERGLVAPFVNLSYGGDASSIRLMSGYQAMARAATARGVEVHWSYMSMAAGVNVGPRALSVGIVAQAHDFT